MDFDKIIEEWKQDCPIDDTTLDKESVKIPTLHGKYLELHSREKIFLNYLEVEYKKLYREKWEYYTGKADESVYREKPFDLKVLKSDVHIYINSDDEMQRADQKVAYLNTVAKYLEQILRGLNNRTFLIKNMIEWKKFTSGAI